MVLPAAESFLDESDGIGKLRVGVLVLKANLFFAQVDKIAHQIFQRLAALQLARALQQIEVVLEVKVRVWDLWLELLIICLHDYVCVFTIH